MLGEPAKSLRAPDALPSAPQQSNGASEVAASSLPAPDPEANRYPYCLVWTPLPLITLFIPFIGHLGICDSSGVIYDFAGPYVVNEERMAFGNPTRYLQLSPSRVRRNTWDDGVRRGNAVYRERMHILCWDNCHNHAAECLNWMEYEGPNWWCGRYNMVILCFWMFFCGSRPTVGGFLAQWGAYVVCIVLGLMLECGRAVSRVASGCVWTACVALNRSACACA